MNSTRMPGTSPQGIGRSRRPARVTRTLTLLGAVALLSATAVPAADAAPKTVRLAVADPCDFTMKNGVSVEQKIAELARNGFTGRVDVELPAGSFTCAGDPVSDDKAFLSDTRFYTGNPVHTWQTVAAGIDIRIHPADADVTDDPNGRQSSCTATTRINGTHPKTDRSSLGPWLRIAPAVTATTGARIDVRCIAVSGYTHSAITVDPTTPGGDDDGVTISGLTFANLQISRIGTTWFATKADGTAREPDEKLPSGRLSCSNGFAGLLLKQTSRSRVQDSTFSSIENRDVYSPTRTNPCLPTAHGVYLRHDSSKNVLVNDLFTSISGAAVDFAVGSDDNVVADSIFNSTGYADAYQRADGSHGVSLGAWVITWFEDDSPPGSQPRGNVLKDARGNRMPHPLLDETAGASQVPTVACQIRTGSGDTTKVVDGDCAGYIDIK